MAHIVRGAIPSPNIWHYPHVYEMENLAVDRAGLIEAAMQEIRVLQGTTLLDIGCGTGFHLPRFVQLGASHVIGVEPHSRLAAAARRRCRRLVDVDVHVGSAQSLPVPDGSIDVSHARWAYFFGPGCEPGLRELARVMRRGGVSFVLDNDATCSTFGRWFAASLPEYDADAVQRFWSQAGWQRRPLDLEWTFDRRADLEAVVRIEFAPEQADRILAGHVGLTVDYAANLWWRQW